MVDVLEPYTKEIADIKRDLPDILRKILIKNKEQVLDILRKEQLGKGLDSKGKKLIHPSKRNRPDRWGIYEPITETYYAKKPPLPRKPKIRDKTYSFEWTGGLFDGMFLHFEDDKSFSLFSKDKKASFLEKEYGDIFTLTKKNNKQVNDEILRPLMFDEIIRRLFV